MDDLISRQDAIDEIDEWIKAFRENGHKESAADARLIQDGIIQLPSAQPERKKGKWILGGYEDMYYICDQCGHKETEYYSIPKANFCKVCGADMRGETDEDMADQKDGEQDD